MKLYASIQAMYNVFYIIAYEHKKVGSTVPTILLLALAFTAALAQPLGSFTDPRDNKSYRTVKIGEQVWMAENLDYEAEGSKCYDNKAENCAKYGRLYDWAAAMRVCPSGWHLPKNAEWDVLYKFADKDYRANKDYSKTAGEDLKTKSGWNDFGDCYYECNGNGKDSYGFAALPGGISSSGGYFSGGGYYGNWWTATEYGAGDAYYRGVYYYYNSAHWSNGSKEYLQSVRCIRD